MHCGAQTYTTWTQSSIVKYPLNGVGQPTGIGRVTHFAFHPTDPKTIWATSASGGLWKTTTEGQYWFNVNTDFFPWTTKMSCIVVDYSNPNTLYIGTGDTDYQAWWGGKRGVWKSTNGGSTWSQQVNAISSNIINRMIMHPTTNTTLLAAVDNGVWKSTNGGSTWTQTLNATTMRDVVMKPSVGGSNTVYACSDTRFWISNDYGNTWSEKAVAEGISSLDGGSFESMRLATPSVGASLRIGVSKANDNYVYLLAHQGNTRTFAGLFRSTNSGTSFTRQSAAADPPTVAQPNILAYAPDGAESGSQGGYNLCITVHPNNANTVFIGSHSVWKSTDGGVNWINRSCWYCGGTDGLHTDLHYLMFSPHYTSPYKLYIAGDGGIARTMDNNDHVWEVCSDGLAATEYGSFGQNKLYKELYLGGTQDNGLQFYWDKNITTIGGGDYYEDFEFDEFDQTLMYADQRYQKYNFDMSGGQSSTGTWATKDNLGNDLTTPTNNAGASPKYFTSPANTNVMFAYKTKVWITQNLKTPTPVWTEMALANGGNAEYKHGAASRVNQDLMYLVRRDNNIFRCDNALAATPTFITLPFPTGASSNNEGLVEAHHTNQNIVWVGLGDRVYKSTNKGGAWTNITNNLPGIGIRKIIHDRFSTNDAVYVATASGVYYTDNSMANWILFSRGMPTLADITDMDIYNDGTANSVLRVATYGRGIWQAELYSPTPRIPTADFVIYSTQQTIGGNQSPTNPCNTYYMLSDRSTGQPTSWSWNITPAAGFVYVNESNATSRNPSIQLTQSGLFTITQTVTNAQGSSNYSSTIRYFQLAVAAACTPTVTDHYGGGYGLGISGVSFVDINNNTGLTSSYVDYTCTKNAVVTTGVTYPITIKGGDLNFGDKVIAWIDYNNDGDFLDAGERVYYDPTTAFVHNGSITIPTTGVLLNTPIRMRVAGYDNWKTNTTDPCVIGSYDGFPGTYNEIEDYAIMIITPPPLPVELISFRAVLESPAVKLIWETAIEKNVSHFMIEKTSNNSNVWTLVDQVKSKGNNSITSYFCYDPSPVIGHNYYRLRTIDNDGTASISKTIDIDLSKQAEFKIWPVPVNQVLSIYIDIDIDIHRDQILLIRDISGKEIMKTSFNGNSTSIDVSKFATGIYFLELNAGGEKRVQKFIKQ